MKFDYCKGINPQTFLTEHRFSFCLSEIDVEKVPHKYGYDSDWIFKTFSYLNSDSTHKPYAAVFLISESLVDDKVDMGINYKQKYEELVELLEPYKVDDSMLPAATLKMLLKYHNK
jgi:hypothetical protein